MDGPNAPGASSSYATAGANAPADEFQENTLVPGPNGMGENDGISRDNDVGLPETLPHNNPTARVTFTSVFFWDSTVAENYLREIMVARQDANETAIRRERIMFELQHAMGRLERMVLEGGSQEQQRFIVADTLATMVQNIVQSEQIDLNVAPYETHVDDHMTHEELLDLEENIESEEIFDSRMNIYKYQTGREPSLEEKDSCCICLEEYNDGQNIGQLNCGHEFHSKCIRMWFVEKNSCPVCRGIAFTTENEFHPL